MSLRNDKTANRTGRPVESSRFDVGSTVRVRSLEDIIRTLDPERRLDGCLFTPQMEQYSGHMYEIIKIVRGVFDERHCRMHQTRTTLYILDDLICDGQVVCFPSRCDRSCYFFWHERWLEAL